MNVMSKRQGEIIAAALELTASGGIQNLTIKNLAESLGITEPAIYRHFRSKSEIVKGLINSFDVAVAIGGGEERGMSAVVSYARRRFAQVAANPPLARVIFAEELFMDDPAYSALLMGMMHRHKGALAVYFAEARRCGEIGRDIPEDQLFRLFFGPVRLMIKQWGLSDGGFDLLVKGDELLDILVGMLR